MRSNKEEKSESLKKIKRIPLTEIIHFVKSFEYEMDKSSVDGINNSKKTKEQVKKENLELLLKRVSKINKVAVEDKEYFKGEINDLFKILKSKLGNDLYLLNLRLLKNFLKGNKPSTFDTLNTSIQVLFDVILDDVNKVLQNQLSDSSLRFLANLFNDSNIELNLSKIIRADLEGANSRIENLRIIANLYIFLVLKNRTTSDYLGKIFIVECVLSEYILDFKSLEKSKYLHKILPEALIDSNPQSKIESSIHFYLNEKNTKLKEELELKVDQIKHTWLTVSRISQEKSQLEIEGKEKNEKLQQLNVEVKEKDKQIGQLSHELSETNLSLNHEINDLKRQMDSLKKGVKLKIIKGTKTALDDMEFIASELSDNHSEQLNDWIKYLRDFFNSLDNEN